MKWRIICDGRCGLEDPDGRVDLDRHGAFYWLGRSSLEPIAEVATVAPVVVVASAQVLRPLKKGPPHCVPQNRNGWE